MAERKAASRLRVERVKARWGLKALAKKAGLNRSSLYRIETGLTQVPSQKTRRALAKVLGVKEADLFSKVGK